MNIGTLLFTLLNGQPVGTDGFGNRYFQERKPRDGRRQRRWVRFDGPEEATKVPPEWHAWLHHTVDAPLDETNRRPWQKPHQPNRTGTALAYRPPGHDYKGGKRAAATGDYEAWSPEAPLLTKSPEAPLLTKSPEAPLLTKSPEAPLLTKSPEAPLVAASPETGLLAGPEA